MEQPQIAIGSQGFVWHELMSTDPDGSERFYREVVGIAVAAPGDESSYRLLLAGGVPVGGVAGPQPGQAGWPSGGPEAHWIAYLASDDVDRAARIARELGGQVLLEPVDVPGLGRAAVLRDPQGAAFGIFQRRS
ncbi:MAG TPA: VOC family protein [Actinomycetota bacterium]|nr:VOC family protein [Actinomycetota bacterium]